jgi:hypothetical protein
VTAQTVGVGTVISKDPLVTAMADLRNNELVLTVRLQGLSTGIRIKGDKLADLIRLGMLAQEHNDGS